MIRWLNLLHVLGFFILALATSLATALLVSLFNQDDGRVSLGLATAVALATGSFLTFALRPRRHDFNWRESTLLVVLAWMSAAGLGALPFYFSPYFASFTDSFFESMSGFTTTGATVLTQIESLPDSLHLWRCLTHWLGGMGIILLGIAILPLDRNRRHGIVSSRVFRSYLREAETAHCGNRQVTLENLRDFQSG